MKYLVTGGAGFIGSHLVCRLVKEGHEVTALDNLSRGKLANLQEVRGQFDWVEGDLGDAETLRRCVRGKEGIFHQAAIPSVPQSFEEPLRFNRTNITNSLELMLEATRAGVKRLVMASSSSVYGDCREFPIQESFCLKPLSPYAVTKMAMEAYGQVFSRNRDIEVVSLRYFNVYGPRQCADSEYASVIPKFISSILKSEPLTIEGDGEQTRDFTYVQDAANANTLAMNTPGADGLVFNVSGGNRASINELVEMLRPLFPQREISVRHCPARPGDIRHSWADTTFAEQKLGYQPAVTLEDGLARTSQAYGECLEQGEFPSR